jgi:hypothetical protein
MSTPVNFNGQPFSVPASGERKWGTQTSNLLIALANNALSKAGGNFTLTADTNFGATYGLIVKYLKSASSNISTTGVVRLANNEGLGFRNAANSADKIFKLDSDDKWTFGAVGLSETALSYLDATSSIQTQLDGKQASGSYATTTDLSNHEADTSTHGVATVAGLTETQTFTNKTLDNPVIDNAATFNQETTPAAPTSGKNKIYPKSDDKWYVQSSGSTEKQLATTDEAFSNPMTTSGDIVYGGVSGAATRLAANSTATKKWLRSLSSGTPTWEEVDIVKGVTDASDAASGYVGQFTSLADTTFRNMSGTGAWYAISYVDIPAGDWDLYAHGICRKNGATHNDDIEACIGSTSAANTGCTFGVDWVATSPPTFAHSTITLTKRVNITGSTVRYYINVRAYYSAGTPQFIGYIYARRRR